MIPIDRLQLDSITRHLNSKSTKGSNNITLYTTYACLLTNLFNETNNFSTYEMAHWINNTDRWLHNRTHINTTGYKRGSILFIDLGATNYRFEPSFTHPCIVLAETKHFILIVPCSSKKYNSGFPEIINATPLDGFSCNTGIQATSIRWVSKNRVLSKLGTTSSSILDKIDNQLLNLIPSHQKILLQKDAEINLLKENISTLSESLQSLQMLNTNLEKSN